MTEATRRERPGGRTARTRRAVIDATTALLSEGSPSALTVGQIAARAGVNEATVYRKWGSKDALLTDVLLTLSAERLTVADTGSLRGDLVETVGAVADFLRTPAGFALAALAATADDETSAKLRDAFWADRFDRARTIFGRAAERGELVDVEQAMLAYEALIGTLHFRILARRRELDADIAERLTDLVLDGLRRPPRD
ncbi:TetR/AcrR family transcriptional regulator [Tsukamurella sp. NPDC003166]|uniref:TetR/AcrR family transcriptional regulator n=1 Tax=Tsukamurella sp. NPDC003166 TaxID=3154444 RepID=UPI0033AA3008